MSQSQNAPTEPSVAYRKGGNRPRDAIVCPRCDAWWGGFNTCHCTGCHRTFTGITAFDQHRAGKHTDDTRHCVEPARAGLVHAGRAYPCWGFPASDDRWGES